MCAGCCGCVARQFTRPSGPHGQCSALLVCPPHVLQVGPKDETYDEYPELSIEDWHRKHGLYVE